MTKKLRLSLDALEVESFAAVPYDDQYGTVAGYSGATCTLCGSTCVGCGTNVGPNCPTQKKTGPCGAC
jgi:hypothetical protein